MSTRAATAGHFTPSSPTRTASPAGSDVDVLYVLRDGVHLGWAINDLSDDLEQLLNWPVDLVAKRALHDLLRLDARGSLRSSESWGVSLCLKSSRCGDLGLVGLVVAEHGE